MTHQISTIKARPVTSPSSLTPSEQTGSPLLTIDLGALVENYRTLQSVAPTCEIAGVIKANGYGCGASEVARALVGAGCKSLFVTSLEEAATLRADESLEAATIHVFNGCFNEDKEAFQNKSVIPLLNSQEEWQDWFGFWQSRDHNPPYGLHIDTGMNRQGMSAEDAIAIAENANLSDHAPALVMSHLASADNPGAPLNAEQRKRFEVLTARFKGARFSLANSAGLYLGEGYHFDVARIGVALYGGQPILSKPAPLRPVAHLHAPILQVRKIEAGDTVGYGETFKASRKTTIATLPLGYADGILRSLSGKGFVYIGDRKAPIVGRISMDLVTIDVTDLPEEAARPGQYVEILGENITVDDLGAAAGSFGYEILTGLGNRYERRYIGA